MGLDRDWQSTRIRKGWWKQRGTKPSTRSPSVETFGLRSRRQQTQRRGNNTGTRSDATWLSRYKSNTRVQKNIWPHGGGERLRLPTAGGNRNRAVKKQIFRITDQILTPIIIAVGAGVWKYVCVYALSKHCLDSSHRHCRRKHWQCRVLPLFWY